MIQPTSADGVSSLPSARARLGLHARATLIAAIAASVKCFLVLYLLASECASFALADPAADTEYDAHSTFFISKHSLSPHLTSPRPTSPHPTSPLTSLACCLFPTC